MKSTDIRHKNMYVVPNKPGEFIDDPLNLCGFRWRKLGEKLGRISPMGRRINE
jgi:hypothetical protein